MKHRTIQILVLVAAALTLSTTSYADSDGYFCTSSGYIAYELRKGITPGVSGHVLRVMRFEEGRGVYLAGEVNIPEFQTHTLTCSKENIEISGWDRTFQQCVLQAVDPAKGAECTSDPTRHFDARTAGPEPQNLARWGRPGTTRLDASDPAHKYSLLLSTVSKASESGLETRYKTELLQVDLQGNVSQRVLLYEGRNVESGD